MRNRRLFRLLAILFAFTLVAAACGDDDDSTSSSGESSASSSSSESSSAEGLNIGTLLPETGALAFLSAPLLEGVNMAIADINAAGGVNGADVTLTPGDSGTDPEIAKKVIREKNVKQYIEDFKNKRKDTKEYSEAVTFLKTYFDESNKKKIDL